MNKFILKNKYLVTFVILAILAWFIYRQFIVVRSPLFPFVAVVAGVWGLGTLVFLYSWPRMTYSAFKRAIVRHGLGGGPIPVNTLYATPDVPSPSASTGSLLATGTDNVLYVGGLLDLSQEPQVLQVPDFSGRYYGVQFADPSDGANFAYAGKRTTGTRAGAYLITGPKWNGHAPGDVTQIQSPNDSVLVIGRVLVEGEGDLPAAYGLASQMRLTPLSRWTPGQ